MMQTMLQRWRSGAALLAGALLALEGMSCTARSGETAGERRPPEAAADASPAAAATPAPASASGATAADSEPTNGGAAEGSPSQQPLRELSGGRGSIRELAEAVLRALAARDGAALDALRVNRREYLELLFPQFPAAKRPGNTVPGEFHWGLLDAHSRKGVVAAIEHYGGQELDLQAAEASGGVEDYGVYRLHRKMKLRVRSKDGRTGTLDILGSIVEMGGRFKILSYPS